MQLPAIVGPFDYCVVTHPHEDHSAWSVGLGEPRWLEADFEAGPLRVRFRAAPHDRDGGLRMGFSRMVRITTPGCDVVHSGDLGDWNADDAAFARGADVLLLAAGGTYTLDGEAAAAFARAVGARVTVPMHCADPAIDLPLASDLAFFTAIAAPVRRLPALTWPLADDLPAVAALERPQESLP